MNDLINSITQTMKNQTVETFVKESAQLIMKLDDALEDNRISIREGFRLAPELVDFLMTLKNRKEIIEEWSRLSPLDKSKIIADFLKETAPVLLSNNVVEDFRALIEKVITILQSFNDAFILAQKINGTP